MVYETGTEQECADAIARFYSWKLSPDARRRRLAQMLGPYDPRHFPADCLPIVVRIVVFHGGADLVEPILAEARYQARREAEDAAEQPERVRVHKVRHERQGRSERA